MIVKISLLIIIINLFSRQRGVFGCGIIGFIGKTDYNKEKIRFLFYHNQERGKDSTGIWTPVTDNVIKECVKAEEFIAKKEFNELLPSNLLIGHVRSGTSGSKTDAANAHPMKYEWLVMAHNGTLSNEGSLAAKEGLIKDKDWKTDTQVIAQILAKRKNHTIFEELDGGTAVLYTDITKKSPILYVYRNSERPLFWGICKDDDNVYISSTESSLKAINCSVTFSFGVNCLSTIEIAKENYEYKSTSLVEKQVLDGYVFSEFKVVSKVVKHTTTNFNSGLKEYINKWVMIDQRTKFKTAIGNETKFVYGDWVFVKDAFLDISNDEMIRVTSKDGEHIEVIRKHYIAYSSRNIEVFEKNNNTYSMFIKGWVMFMDDVENKEGVVKIKEGQICKVIASCKSGNITNYSVLTEDNIQYNSIKHEWIRPLVSEEQKLIWETDKPVSNQTPMRYPPAVPNRYEGLVACSNCTGMGWIHSESNLCSICDGHGLVESRLNQNVPFVKSNGYPFMEENEAEEEDFLATETEIIATEVEIEDSVWNQTVYKGLRSEFAKSFYVFTGNTDDALVIDDFLLEQDNAMLDNELSSIIENLENYEDTLRYTEQSGFTNISEKPALKILMEDFKEVSQDIERNLYESFSLLLEKIKHQEEEIKNSNLMNRYYGD
jgi:predicted glutamine amidotransferase